MDTVVASSGERAVPTMPDERVHYVAAHDHAYAVESPFDEEEEAARGYISHRWAEDWDSAEDHLYDEW